MIACSSCSHSNPEGARFCESCGQAVESTADAAAAADAIEAEFLLDQAKAARGPLMVVAVLMTLATALETATSPASTRTMVFMIDGGIALTFWALWWLSNKRPFAAASVGLALYVVIQAVVAWANPAAFFGGILGLAIRVAVIASLIQAVRAGVKHRAYVRDKGID